MKPEAESGMVPLGTKECQGLPNAHQSLEEARKAPPLEPSEGAWPCPYLDCELPASRTVQKWISAVFNHLVCGALLQQP